MKTLSILAMLLAGGRARSGTCACMVSLLYAPDVLEPGRGELLEAWLAKFNASQSDVEIEAVAIPYSSFAKTVLYADGWRQGRD